MTLENLYRTAMQRAAHRPLPLWWLPTRRIAWAMWMHRVKV